MEISSSSSSSSSRNLVLGLGVVVFAVLCVFIPALPLISAQVPSASPAPSPFSSSAPDECFNSILNMSDCLTYVESGSNLTKPEKGCCPALAGLVESSPICLCQLLGKGGSTFGITLDVNKAIKLPKVCKVDTPPISLCSAFGVPVSVPTSSEGPAGSSMSPVAGGAAAPGSPDTMMSPSSSTGGPNRGSSASSLIRDYYSSSSSMSFIFFSSCILGYIVNHDMIFL